MNNKITVLTTPKKAVNDRGGNNFTFGINPQKLIEDAAVVATSLTDIIKEKKLFSVIEGRKYVHATGWGVLMAMRGINPWVTKSERLNREGEIAYESEVDLISYDGRVIGRASAICSSKEPNKARQQEFAIKSMAQTRATSKAARLSLGWIIKLAGYEPTPAEEMIDVGMQEKKENQAVVSLHLKGAENSSANVKAAIAAGLKAHVFH